MTKHFLPNTTTGKAGLFHWSAQPTWRDFARDYLRVLVVTGAAVLALRWGIAAIWGV